MAKASGGYYTNGLTIATPATLPSDATFPVDTQAPEGQAPQTLAVPMGLADQFSQANDTVTAHAGGGAASATQLDYGITEIAVCATAANSVKLPPAVEGTKVYLWNKGAQSAQVFGGGTSTINGVAFGTGVAQAAGLSALYFCVEGDGDDVAGSWARILSA